MRSEGLNPCLFSPESQSLSILPSVFHQKKTALKKAAIDESRLEKEPLAMKETRDNFSSETGGKEEMRD